MVCCEPKNYKYIKDVSTVDEFSKTCHVSGVKHLFYTLTGLEFSPFSPKIDLSIFGEMSQTCPGQNAVLQNRLTRFCKTVKSHTPDWVPILRQNLDFWHKSPAVRPYFELKNEPREWLAPEKIWFFLRKIIKTQQVELILLLSTSWL